jgi:hypothetical protein
MQAILGRVIKLDCTTTRLRASMTAPNLEGATIVSQDLSVALPIRDSPSPYRASVLAGGLHRQKMSPFKTG